MPDPKKKSLDYGKDINLPYQPKGISISEPKKLPEKYPAKYGQHPEDIPESALEKSIKFAGMLKGSMLPQDLPYFEQYMHPQYGILDRQPLRPTKMGSNFDEDEWYKAATYPQTQGRYANTAGLGNHITSQGEDYNSIYDKWDFNTDSPLLTSHPLGLAPEAMAKSVLRHLGTPFHVYDRLEKPQSDDDYGIDLDEFPLIKPSNRGQDINLPASGIGPSSIKIGGVSVKPLEKKKK